ncbi:hypothetical protein [Methanofollis ethanolicus]|uniref:hypothetical protein n=1 Tax=Methanofollis ethanolicus TaxID=488124 RepID=UPI00082A241C|nr:hypothetical protein [Methanofollis ethanolicus]
MTFTRPIALLLVFVTAVVLVAYPLIVTAPSHDPHIPRAETVCAGNGTVIVIEGICAVDVTLTDPEGVGHTVGRGVLRPTAGGRNTTWYLFRYGTGRADTPEYWITNEPGMVFSGDYLDTVEPFPSAGIWEVGINDGAGTVRVRVRVEE